MNVTDVEKTKATGDRFDMIFARQKELMEKYHEMGIDVLPERFHIDDRECQKICKDFAWRITEELAEASDAMEDRLHSWEEAADALHFMVELFLINGISANELARKLGLDIMRSPKKDRLDKIVERFRPLEKISAGMRAFYIVKELGLAMNCLKNKPWKQTQMETDVNRFQTHLIRAFGGLFTFMAEIGMDSETIFDIYFRKSDVNKFRQRSNY